MPSHMMDSVFFRDLFGSEAMRAIFDDASLLQKWLDVEAAIARGQARAGLIPASAAEEIKHARKVWTPRLSRRVSTKRCIRWFQ
jgi:3-carboxy-cis,cis-muconate cycloisomerase